MTNDDYGPLPSREEILRYIDKHPGNGGEIYNGLGGPTLPTMYQLVERVRELERSGEINGAGPWWWPVRHFAVSDRVRRRVEPHASGHTRTRQIRNRRRLAKQSGNVSSHLDSRS